MQILILALSGIGDALMFTPAAKLLRENFPQAKIDALVMFSGVKNIYDRTGLFDEVIHFDFMAEGAVKSLKFVLGRRGKYTHSISVYPSNRKEYNGIQWLFGAKRRGQVEYLRADTSNLGWLNNVRIREIDTLHNVEENVNLVKEMFSLEEAPLYPLLFPLNEEDHRFADDFCASSLKAGVKKVGFHPGCATFKNHINRRWEPEKFAALGKLMKEQNGFELILFGGPEEKELREKIKQLAGEGVFHEPQTKNLSQSAALIKKCDLFITNDSSLMHVSSAMRVKVLALIGPTNTNYIHPWKTEHKIVTLNLECAPCFFYSPKPLECKREDLKYKCIKELTVEMVYKEAMKFIPDRG